MKRNTYIRDEKGIAEAIEELRQVVREGPTPEDLAWQDDLPELPDDDETIVEIRPGPKAKKTTARKTKKHGLSRR